MRQKLDVFLVGGGRFPCATTIVIRYIVLYIYIDKIILFL